MTITRDNAVLCAASWCIDHPGKTCFIPARILAGRGLPEVPEGVTVATTTEGATLVYRPTDSIQNPTQPA